MGYRHLAIACLASAAAFALSACSHKPSQAEIAALPAPADGMGGSYAEDDGTGSQADLRRTAGDRVLFALDSYALDPEAVAILRRQATWLATNAGKTVTVEGHCDERGTREYNVALGERRANAAKNYLASLGISPARISVVSYGKERPEATGSDEQSYAQNRRAVTVIIR